MKKQIILVTGFIFVIGLSIISCGKKKSTGISPTYGSTGNPNPNPTVTGNVTPTNPAINNSGLSIGGPGWSNPSCGTTNSLALKGFSTSVDVTLSFDSAIKSGTYSIGSSPGPYICAMTVLNAPNQPAGIVWYGRSGTVVVYTTTNSINANLSNIVCTQSSFNFPTVVVNGNLSCGQ